MSDERPDKYSQVRSACQRALGREEQGYGTEAEIRDELIATLVEQATRERPPKLRASYECVRSACVATMTANFISGDFLELETPTGIAAFDEGMALLHRGELVVIAGAAESGRTALALYLACAVALQRKPSVFRAYRETERSLMFRVLRRRRDGSDKLYDDEEANALAMSPLWMLCDGVSSVDSTSRLCDSLYDRLREPFPSGLSLIVVDDVDHAPEGVDFVLRALKRYARLRGVAVVATVRQEHAELRPAVDGPDVLLSLKRSRGEAIVVHGERVDCAASWRTEIVLSTPARWIDAAESNRRHAAASNSEKATSD
jgi:hypothetical protein